MGREKGRMGLVWVGKNVVVKLGGGWRGKEWLGMWVVLGLAWVG